MLNNTNYVVCVHVLKENPSNITLLLTTLSLTSFHRIAIIKKRCFFNF